MLKQLQASMMQLSIRMQELPRPHAGGSSAVPLVDLARERMAGGLVAIEPEIEGSVPEPNDSESESEREREKKRLKKHSRKRRKK